MQTKFKIGDKVKVLTKAYPLVYDTEGVVTRVAEGGSVYQVERAVENHPPDQYGYFGHDCWRYAFYASELELVEEKPEPNYVIGQEVYVAAGITRNLKPAVIVDAVVRNGLLKVSVGGFDCYVEEERVYTRVEVKGN